MLLRIRRFRLADLDRLMEIERAAFPKAAYPRDLFLDEPISFRADWEPPLLWAAAPLTGTVSTVSEQQSLEDEEREILTGKK